MQIEKNVLHLHSQLRIKIQWSIRLGVRTPGFHPGNRGSNPLWTTNFEKNFKQWQIINHRRKEFVQTMQKK